MTLRAQSFAAAAVTLAIAGFGCDGCSEPAPPVAAPRIDSAGAGSGSGAATSGGTRDGAIAAGSGSGSAGSAAAPVGALDAPAGTLDALYTGFAAAESADPSSTNAAARALMLFFGDSHTAGDSLTSRLRITLQARFGDAGRGMVAAGRPPARHYYQRDVHYGVSGTWRAAVGGKRGDTEPFGIGGLRVFGSNKGAQLWVETCGDCQAGQRVAQYELFYYAAPDHGAIKVRVDDQPWQRLSTRTTAIEPPHPARAVIPTTDGAHRLTIEHAGGGQVDLFGVVMERLRPGVIVDSLGVVGRRLNSLRSWDWSVIGEQLSTRDPKLVVLQYGTNEADDPDLDLDALGHYYDETIARIRAAAPGASVLVLGPPDMGAREAGAQCDRMKPRPAPGGGSQGSAEPIPECQWRTPDVLGKIIAVEHAAAVRNKVAFFDTFAAMGGGDQMHAWVTADPKVAYKDHVHFTDLGYQRWADALSGELLTGYARWRHDRGMPATIAKAPPPPVHASDALLPGPVPVTP